MSEVRDEAWQNLSLDERGKVMRCDCSNWNCPARHPHGKKLGQIWSDYCGRTPVKRIRERLYYQYMSSRMVTGGESWRCEECANWALSRKEPDYEAEEVTS